MKKLIAIFLAALTALSLTACAAKSDAQPDASEIPDALTILNTVWASYSEDEKFPAAGGDYSEANMMNGNTFTCGALRLTDAGKLDEAAKEIRDYIMAKQWMCGFPDKLIVVSVDNYLISCFGAEDLVNTFRDKLQAAYSGAVVITDEPIVA